MKIYEIDSDTKKLKEQLEMWYIQWVSSTNSDFKHILESRILELIEDVYPTGYSGIDERLIEVKNVLYKIPFDILKNGN